MLDKAIEMGLSDKDIAVLYRVVEHLSDAP